MYNALGFIEISGTTAAITALDIMCKTANVELVTWERKLGGRLVTLVVTGEVSAVTDSIEAAKRNGLIALKLVELSAARLKRKNAPDDTSKLAPDMRQSEPVASKKNSK